MRRTKNLALNQVPKKRTNYNVYIIFSVFVLMFGYIIAKGVSVPKPVIFLLSAGAFIGLFFSSFSNPVFSLLALIAYLPFAKEIIGNFGAEIVGLNLTNILLPIVILGWVSNSLKKRESTFTKSSLNVVVALFTLLGLFSVLRAKYLYGSAYALENFFIGFKGWITPILLYYIGLNMVKNKETLKKVIFVMLTVCLIVALMAIRDYLNIGNGSSLDESRVGGVFGQPNQLAGFFVYNMFLFVSFMIYYWKDFRYWLLIVPFLICFRGIMVTFSRGAYIAFAFGGMALAFFRSKILFVFVLIGLFVSLLVPGVLPEGIRYRLASTFGGEKVISADFQDITDASAGNRIEIWKGAVGMIKDQPLFGFGYGTFPYIIGYYAPGLQEMDAHNTYLIIAAEMGIIALFLFILILFILIKNAMWLLKNVKDKYFKAFALGALGNIFGLMVVNMFGSRLNSEEVSSYFWIYAGLIMAAVAMKKKGIIE